MGLLRDVGVYGNPGETVLDWADRASEQSEYAKKVEVQFGEVEFEISRFTKAESIIFRYFDRLIAVKAEQYREDPLNREVRQTLLYGVKLFRELLKDGLHRCPSTTDILPRIEPESTEVEFPYTHDEAHVSVRTQGRAYSDHSDSENDE